MNRRPNPAIHDYCRPCFGYGFHTVRKGTDYQDEDECTFCDGSGMRTKETT